MKRLLFIVFLTVFVLVAGLAALLGTETGTGLLFGLAQRLHPPLKVRSTSGTLLGSLVIHELSYRNEAVSLAAERISLAWRPWDLKQRHLTIERLALAHPRFEWLGGGTESGPVVLPAVFIPATIDLKRLSVRGLEVVLPDAEPVTLDQLDLAAVLAGEHLELRRFEAVMARLHAKGKGVLRLRENWPLTASLDWLYRADRLWNGKAEFSGDLMDTLKLEHRLAAPFSVATQGTVGALFEEPRFDLQGSWEEIGWPLTGDKEWSSPQGTYRVRGRIDDYRVEIHTRLSGIHLPPTELSLRGKGRTTGIFLQPLLAEGPTGHLEATGELRWRPSLVWNLRLQGKDLDPAPFQPQWPGTLALTARTSGRLQPELAVEVELQKLTGVLRDQPIRAGGRFHYRGNVVKAEKVELQWAGNRLQVDGEGNGRRIDLEFELDAPHLERLDPGLKGNVTGAGKVIGDLNRPHLDIRVEGRRIVWGDRLKIRGVSVTARGHPEDPASQVEIGLDHLQWARWRFDRLMLSGRGGLAGHEIRLDAEAPQGSVEVHVQGGIAKDGKSHWEGEIRRLPLALLEPVLPHQLSASGDLVARFFYRQSPRRREGGLELGFSGGALSTVMADGETLTLPLDQGEGEVKLDDRSLYLSFNLPFAGYGWGKGELMTDLETHRLKGRSRLRISRLEMIQVFVPQLNEVRGSAEGEVVLMGSWAHPKVQGKLAVIGASAEVPAAGLRLQAIQLQAATRPDATIAFQGQALSGPGTIALHGNVALSPEVSLSMRLEGDRFLAADLPRAKVIVSPAVDLTASSQSVEIRGNIQVPEAKITLKTSLLPDQQPDMVSVSPDEVIVGRPQAPPKTRLNISADVLLTLGDDVYFKGYGVDSQLRGELRLRSWKDMPKAEGVVEVTKGTFAAYGQKLHIAKGEIIFSGPLDNPALDIEMERRLRREKITITLEIRGFAQEPAIHVSSDPFMPEDEALSYLVTGRSFRGGAAATPAGSMEKQLTGALSSLGVGYLKKWGVDEYAEVEYEEGFVMLGRHLTPDLYVGYAVDVFGGVGEAVVRYDLTEYLTLEGRYGESQSGDLYYTLETE